MLMNRAALVAALLLILAGCKDKNTDSKVDFTPPAPVLDLTITPAASDTVLLTWTAPGDDGEEGRALHYEIRYSVKPVTAQNWSSMAALDSPPSPRAAGEADSLLVTGIGVRDWYFLLKTADEAYNWSLVSNVGAWRLQDRIPPGPVLDLTAESAGIHSITLRWTAPGDDGSAGQSSLYDIRYAEEFMTPEVWANATRVEGEPAPAPAGTQESFTVNGLALGHMYYFSILTADEVSNSSFLSNTASAVPGLRRLTFSPESSAFGAQRPDWSPDGTKIAFAGDWDAAGNEDLYVIAADGGGAAVRMTMDPAEDTHPRWSPNGQKIAFTSNRNGKDEIWVMDATAGSPPLLLESFPQGASEPTWSPHGEQIAFIVRTSATTTAVYADSIDGVTARVLYDYPSQNASPAWTTVESDSTMIAFTSNRNGNDDIWAVPLMTFENRAVRLTFWESAESAPSWSPDGGRLAFSSGQAGNLDIWTMQFEGEDPRQITSAAGNETYPAWSPDGMHIAFTSRRSGQSEIWIQDLETGH